jgi:hypothetical protein
MRMRTVTAAADVAAAIVLVVSELKREVEAGVDAQAPEPAGYAHAVVALWVVWMSMRTRWHSWLLPSTGIVPVYATEPESESSQSPVGVRELTADAYPDADVALLSEDRLEELRTVPNTAAP